MSAEGSGNADMMEHDQQLSGEEAATAGGMTIRALSIELTNQYPAVTKRKYSSFLALYNIDITSVIPVRAKAEKWESTMAAVAQVMAVLIKRGLDSPTRLIFPVKQEKNVTAMREFETEISRFLTPQVIEDLELVWTYWTETIAFASAIDAGVYKRNFYGPPHSIAWVEFIGIAVAVTKHCMISTKHHDTEYPMKLILKDVSRLRRWLRCYINPDGFRRSDTDWLFCWQILNEDETEIPAESGFPDKKTKKRFHFVEEPQLGMEDDEEEGEGEGEGRE